MATRDSVQRLIQAVDGVGQAVVGRTKEWGAAIDAETARIAAKAEQAGKHVEDVLSKAAQNASQAASKAAADFEAVTADFTAANNLWSAELKKGLDALKSGALDRTEFLRQYGADVTLINGKNKSLQEALASVDFGQFKANVQALIADLQRQQLSIEEIAQRVSALGGQFAEGIGDMIERWKAGQVSFQQLAAQIQLLQQKFPGSDLDALLKQLGPALQQQEADGFL